MALNERLAELLGLNAGVGEDALFDAVSALHAAQAADGVALQSQLDQIGAALGVAQGGDLVAAAQAAAQAEDAAGADEAQFMALQSELAQVTTQMNALHDERRREQATAFVDQAIADKRVGISAQRDRYIAMHMRDRAEAEALINSMPSLGDSGTTALPPQADGEVSLNAAQAQAAALLGVPLKDYQAQLEAEQNGGRV